MAILAARHSRIIENGQKGGRWVELVAETTPTKRDSGDSSSNPPVTQVATPLIMQNFNCESHTAAGEERSKFALAALPATL